MRHLTKYWVGLILFSLVAPLAAQSGDTLGPGEASEDLPVLVYQLNLDSSCWLQSRAQSKVMSFPDSINYGFLGFSAFTRDTLNKVDLSLRYRIQGKWGDWRRLAPPAHGHPRQRQSWQAPPISENIEAWQVRTQDSLDKPLVVRLFYAPPKKKVQAQPPHLSPKAEGNDPCSCPPPPLCNRLCWCPGGGCPPPSYSRHQPSHFIIHHSAGFTDYHDYPWVVAYYWDLHVNTNGWSDIGYNWLIDPDGVVYQGRGARNVGAHFSCMNQQASGIALIGNYMDGPPSSAARNSLKDLLAFLSCKYSIDIADSSLHSSSQLFLAHLSGHRDANAASPNQGCPSGTVCPGDSLYPLLGQISKEVRQDRCLLGSPAAGSPSRLELYPQPAQDWLKFKGLQGSPRSGTIFDPQGRELQTVQLEPSTARVYTGQLDPGLYQLQLKGASASQVYFFQVAR